MKLDPMSISIRDLAEEDIPHVLKYWFHSPLGFVESMGVDTAKLSTELEMEKRLKEKCKANHLLGQSKLNALAILYRGQAIGFHTLFPIAEGDFGIFHAHIWKPEMRKCGVGMSSYPLACRIFMERFNLKRILFKTPIQNIGAIRVKEKLGIRNIGEEIIEFGIIKAGTRAKVFELTCEEMKTKSHQQSP
jgi:RimJ/RimL family protein N-acetyltransferase